jgi:hypothetical protein
MNRDYIVVAFDFNGGKDIAVAGVVSNRKCFRIGPNCPKGSIARGMNAMFWWRMLPMMLLPCVKMPVVGLHLLTRPSFCFLYV